MELKVSLLTDDSIVVSDLKKQLAAWDEQIEALEKFSGNLNTPLTSMRRNHGLLRMEFDSTRAAISAGEGLI